MIFGWRWDDFTPRAPGGNFLQTPGTNKFRIFHAGIEFGFYRSADSYCGLPLYLLLALCLRFIALCDLIVGYRGIRLRLFFTWNASLDSVQCTSDWRRRAGGPNTRP